MLMVLCVISLLAGLIWGVATSTKRYSGAYLDREFAIRPATPARRLSGNLLDCIILLFSFGIGWLVWFTIVAPRGQSPGKAIVSTYVIDRTGNRSKTWYMWRRELLAKFLPSLVFTILTAGIGLIVASYWCLWTANKQCLWDKLMRSYVAHSPDGPPEASGPASIEAATATLRLLQQLKANRTITLEEYEERRQRLVKHLL